MSEPVKTLKELFEELKNLRGPVVVVGHARPDGDCIGSAGGLVEILRAMGIEAYGMIPEPIPEFLRFIVKDIPWLETDLLALQGKTVVAVDTAAKKLLESFSGVEYSVAIDHHAIRSEGVGQKEYVDSTALSVCQILAELVRETGLTVSKKGLEALYSGILSDTYRFLYGSGDKNYSRVLRIAAWLVDQGIEIQSVTERLTNTYTRSFLNLLGLTMGKSEFLEGGKIVLVGLGEEEMNRVGAVYGDKDILVSMLRSIAGVEISAVIIHRNGRSYGSVRGGRPAYSVNKLCAVFGGGGHDMAGGIRDVQEPLETFLPRFRKELLAHWKVYGPK